VVKGGSCLGDDAISLNICVLYSINSERFTDGVILWVYSKENSDQTG